MILRKIYNVLMIKKFRNVIDKFINGNINFRALCIDEFYQSSIHCTYDITDSEVNLYLNSGYKLEKLTIVPYVSYKAESFNRYLLEHHLNCKYSKKLIGDEAKIDYLKDMYKNTTSICEAMVLAITYDSVQKTENITEKHFKSIISNRELNQTQIEEIWKICDNILL